MTSSGSVRSRIRPHWPLRWSSPASNLEGPAQARIALAGGEPFLATVVEETTEEVTFRKDGGVGARVKKTDLKEQQIARTPEQKRALAEAKYQRRAPALRGAEDFLDLARFCRAYDLPAHLTYLLEKALEEPGDALEKGLYDVGETARAAGDEAKADLALDLLRHFFRSGTHTRNAALARKGTPPPPGKNTASGANAGRGRGSRPQAGDVATGAKILGQASDGIKRTHLELGGKAPVIVFDDAEVEAVVSGVRTFGYYNAGQDCPAACRLYAGAKVYDRLVADLSGAVSTIKTGLQRAEGEETGPLIPAEHRDRVAGFVARARKQKHIEVTAGGNAGPGGGFFYEPTVVAGARQSDEIVRREVFGPVVSVTRFKDTEQANRWGTCRKLFHLFSFRTCSEVGD